MLRLTIRPDSNTIIPNDRRRFAFIMFWMCRFLHHRRFDVTKWNRQIDRMLNTNFCLPRAIQCTLTNDGRGRIAGPNWIIHEKQKVNSTQWETNVLCATDGNRRCRKLQTARGSCRYFIIIITFTIHIRVLGVCLSGGVSHQTDERFRFRWTNDGVQLLRFNQDIRRIHSRNLVMRKMRWGASACGR